VIAPASAAGGARTRSGEDRDEPRDARQLAWNRAPAMPHAGVHDDAMTLDLAATVRVAIDSSLAIGHACL